MKDTATTTCQSTIRNDVFSPSHGFSFGLCPFSYAPRLVLFLLSYFDLETLVSFSTSTLLSGEEAHGESRLHKHGDRIRPEQLNASLHHSQTLSLW